MATNNATLASFFPADAEIYNHSVSLQKYNGVPASRFPKENGISSPIPAVFYDFVLPRGANAGYTATTGVKVYIHWSAPHGQVTGAVRWAAAVDLKGQTDLPLACKDNTPAAGSANDIGATTNINTTTAGGLNVTTISIPLASIQNGQTTAPAAGDFCRLRVRRAVENVADTLADDAFIHYIELQDY